GYEGISGKHARRCHIGRTLRPLAFRRRFSHFLIGRREAENGSLDRTIPFAPKTINPSSPSLSMSSDNKTWRAVNTGCAKRDSVLKLGRGKLVLMMMRISPGIAGNLPKAIKP